MDFGLGFGAYGFRLDVSSAWERERERERERFFLRTRELRGSLCGILVATLSVETVQMTAG